MRVVFKKYKIQWKYRGAKSISDWGGRIRKALGPMSFTMIKTFHPGNGWNFIELKGVLYSYNFFSMIFDYSLILSVSELSTAASWLITF